MQEGGAETANDLLQPDLGETVEQGTRTRWVRPIVLAIVACGVLVAGAVLSGLASPGSGDETGGAFLTVLGLAVALAAALDATRVDGREMLWRAKRRRGMRV